MLHDERPIELGELVVAIRRLYKIMDKLDSMLISYEGGKRESVFVKSSVLYNRKAISFAYDLTNQFVQYESEKDVKLVLYNLPAENIIESLDAYEKTVEEFCMKGDLQDYSDKLYMDTSFLALLGANLGHLVGQSLGLCIRYECDLLQRLEPNERIREVNRRIKEIERDQYFFSKEHAIVLYEYRTRKLQKLKNIRDDLEEEFEVKDTYRTKSQKPLEMEEMKIDWGGIRDLIASNQWNKVLNKIKSTVNNNPEILDSIVAIESQITAYKTSSIKGIMSFEEDSISKNIITARLLALIKLLEV